MHFSVFLVLPLVFLGTKPFRRMLAVGCFIMVSLLDSKFKEYCTWKKNWESEYALTQETASSLWAY